MLRTISSRFFNVKRLARHGNICMSSAGMSTLSNVEEFVAKEFRRLGHFSASLDPLGIVKPETLQLSPNAQSELKSLAKDFSSKYHNIYCGEAGFEFDHLKSDEERQWFASRLESFNSLNEWAANQLSPAERRNAAVQMLKADIFENFLGKKFSSFKRYSGEGADVMHPVVDTIFSTCAKKHHMTDIVLGVGHRGKLALLVGQLDYPSHRLFNKINGYSDMPSNLYAIDDVTNHISASTDKIYDGNNIHISMLNNPSHLEVVGSVAMGKVRAKQSRLNLQDRSNVLCMQIHGDAAMSGQGCVTEASSLTNLSGYSVLGSIHVVVNNQVGFTTEGLVNGRSSSYCTDMAAKGIGAPVIHVNSNNIEVCLAAAKLCVDYRQAFHKDIFLDLLCYRKFGHNEVDEPSFTQPIMYQAIRSMSKSPTSVYLNKLMVEGLLSQEKVDSLTASINNVLSSEINRTVDRETKYQLLTGKQWTGMRFPSEAKELYQSPDSGIPLGVIETSMYESVRVPSGFNIHPKLLKSHVDSRINSLTASPAASKGDVKVDWSTAEAIAFGSLLSQGFNVRMSGQDSGRGTFSQRHAILTDQTTGKTHCPLGSMFVDSATRNSGKFEIINSNLSELAVLGFEHGYSLEACRDTLVLWEAQFGDFANAAQIVIDNFIATSEVKWLKQTGIVILLPHGFDGAGPEHSSGRIERWLQLCDMGSHKGLGYSHTNMIVANLSTPAQYCHFLRRQMMRPFRKPAVIFTPKILLRLSEATSKISQMMPGTRFLPIIANECKEPEKINNIILCSGKIYYDLMKENSVVASSRIIRIEELCPFPAEELYEVFRKHTSLKKVVWVQEEPENAGAWPSLQNHVTSVARRANPKASIHYIGRGSLPAVAVGLSKDNTDQHTKLIKELNDLKLN